MSDAPRRAMTPEALCNALDTCSRTVRRIVFEAIDGGRAYSVTDLRIARGDLNGFLDYAEKFIAARCGPEPEVDFPEPTEGAIAYAQELERQGR